MWAPRAPAFARREFCRPAASGWCSAGNRNDVPGCIVTIYIQ